jgi:tripartite-type tricarboxylate transporter receptor subunit TctC
MQVRTNVRAAHRRVLGRMFALGVGATLLAAGAVSAEEQFPSKTINVVTHAGPGGGTDITTRMMMLRGRKEFGQDMVVVSKTGGSGAAALQYLKSVDCDGYTIMTLTQSHLLQIAQGKVPVTIDEVVGLARATLDPQLIAVRADSDIQTLDDLIAKSKAKEGGLKWGTTFVGGTDHVAIHNFTKAAGDIPYTVVPFQGGGDIVTNLVGGDVEVGILNYAEGEAQLSAGELRPVAVLAEERIDSLPDTPTAKEQGVDAEASTIRGFITLACVPEERLKILEQGLLEAMNHSVYQNYISSSGMPKNSVVGRQEWTAQIRRLYDESRSALEDLGML